MHIEFRDAIEQFSGLYCIMRTNNSGVHVGTVAQVIPAGCGHGWMVVLHNARRIRDWKGAFTLSELARNGFDEQASRLSITVPIQCVFDAIELIPCALDVAKMLQTKEAHKL